MKRKDEQLEETKKQEHIVWPFERVCPVCGKPVHDTFQRIVGYLVPTRSYSKERFNEFTTRKWYEYAEMMRE